MNKALKRHGRPEQIVSDGLRSYPAAVHELGVSIARQWAAGSTTEPKIHICHFDDASGRCSASAE